MFRGRQFSFISSLIVFALVFSFLIPSRVLADDGTPPLDPTSEEVVTTEEPVIEVATQEPVVTEEPVTEIITQEPVMTRPP